jgi:hypothetical protein
MEHQAWVGSDYERGLGGQRVLIAGFSHWSDEPDTIDFTKNQVRSWAAGDEPKPFGVRLRAFFGIDNPAEFWNGIAFFNTLPTLIGGAIARFADGDEEQRRAVPKRVLGIIGELQPDRVFVFSRKAWHVWPDYTGGLRNGTLRVAGVGEFDAGAYRHSRGEALAFGFSHPQFAAVGPTRTAVSAALSATAVDLADAEGV